MSTDVKQVFFCLYFILPSIRVDLLLLKWCTTFDLMLCNFSLASCRNFSFFLFFFIFSCTATWCCWFINKVLNFIFLPLILTLSLYHRLNLMFKKYFFFYYRRWREKLLFWLQKHSTNEVKVNNNNKIYSQSLKINFYYYRIFIELFCACVCIWNACVEWL